MDEQPFETTMRDFAQSMAQSYTTLSNAMQQIIKQTLPLVQSVNDAIWSAYRSADMPYGETHEGLMRWMEDLSKINHAQQEIEYIQQRHQMLADARKLGARMRAKKTISRDENES